MECEEMRCDSEVEVDSDHEEVHEDGCYGDGWFGHSLYDFHTSLDSDETGTVRRRPKTIVTPKMAMESFRLSFLNDDQDVNFDAILGELYELESQLNNTHKELSRSLAPGSAHPPPPAAFQDGGTQGNSDTGHVSEQEELDRLATEITRGLHYHKSHSVAHQQQQQHSQQHDHHLTVAGSGVYGSGSLYDTAETDSAFSDNASLPSSESFTSMGTFSSSADTTSSSSGETCSMNSAVCGGNSGEDDQIARKAEKIRIALEKIKDAKIRKLFVRAFAKDGSSKSILVDEKMTISQVCSQLADKNHMRLNHKLCVVELMPELLMERILEDHDSLVENMVMWTKDSKNKIMFEERMDKYDLFRNPEKYLLNTAAVKQGTLAPQQKDRLIQEFFTPDNVCVPAVEGALYLKSDGKKAWKKFFFVLRASGLYYSPKGKASKNSKDLVCLVQFEYVEVYHGLGWKKKYHAPTDYCFALKIQKKTSKYIRYFCAETETAFDQWIMGIRIAKLGKQMLHNYERLTQEISMWDLRQPETGSVAADTSVCQMLNHADLSDSRMSVPEPAGCHSVIQVLSRSLVHKCTMNETPRNVVNIDVLGGPSHKVSESGGSSDGRSLSGSIGSSSVGSGMSESGHKTPIKRVSFSKTNSIINGDCSEQTVRHRDSIISSSTDSSEDSNTSGETRLGSSFRGKMRPKLPVTTETTRQLADMCNVSIDETAEGIYAETHHHRPQAHFSRSDRKRSSMPECRRPHSSSGSEYGHRPAQLKNSSSIKQHSLDSGAEASHIYSKYNSPSSESHYQHIGRRSEILAMPSANSSKSSGPVYSTVYSPLREEHTVIADGDLKSSYGNRQELSEKIYNQVRCPTPSLPNETAKERQCSGTISSPIVKDRLYSETIPSSPAKDRLYSETIPSPSTKDRLYSGTVPSPSAKDRLFSATIPSPSAKDRLFGGTIPSPSAKDRLFGGTIPSPSAKDRLYSGTIPPPPQFREMTSESNHMPHTYVRNEPSAALHTDKLVTVQLMQTARPLSPVFVSSSMTSAEMAKNQQQHHHLKESQYNVPVPLSHSGHSKIALPPTLPKPNAVSAGIASSMKIRTNELPHDPVSSPVSTSNAESHPPTHVATNSSVTTTCSKIPPPTLPKSSVYSRAASPVVASCSSRSSLLRSASPLGDRHPSEKASLAHTAGAKSDGEHKNSSEHENKNCHFQSSTLPLMPDLYRKHQETDMYNLSADIRNDQPLSSSSNSMSVSAGSLAIKLDKKTPPPPPPKRHENTRLSVELTRQQQNPCSEQNGVCVPSLNPVYENIDDMMNIDELPPPPPELLMDLPASESEEQNCASTQKPKPPPPPPKRSKETQLYHDF